MDFRERTDASFREISTHVGVISWDTIPYFMETDAHAFYRK